MPALQLPSHLDGTTPYVAAELISGAWTPTISGAAHTRALSVGGAGTGNVDFLTGGTNVALVLPAGIAKIAITRVYAGATATGLVALY